LDDERIRRACTVPIRELALSVWPTCVAEHEVLICLRGFLHHGRQVVCLLNAYKGVHLFFCSSFLGFNISAGADSPVPNFVSFNSWVILGHV
jgi:hypothetical protein